MTCHTCGCDAARCDCCTGIVTMTPGTLSCEVDDASPTLLVHALDGRAGAEAIAADIRQRYEAPLMEIFD